MIRDRSVGRQGGEHGVDQVALVRRRQRQVGLAAGDGVDRRDLLQHLVKVIVAAGDDPAQQVALAGDGVDLDDLGKLARAAVVAACEPWAISSMVKASTERPARTGSTSGP